MLAVLGLATLLAMLVVFLRAVKSSQKPPAQLEAAAQAAELPEGEAAAAALPGAAPVAELPAPPTPAELEDRRVRAIEVASRDPVGAAIIVSRWLSAGDQPAARESGEAA